MAFPDGDDPNLEVYYKGDESLVDSSANGNDASVSIGSIVYSTDVPFTGSGTTHSFDFDGTNQIKSGAGVDVDGGGWSYAFWCKTTDVTNIFITHLIGTGSGGNVIIRLRSSGNSRVDCGVTFSNTNLNDGVWKHVAVTFDGIDSSGLALYVDGSLAESGTGTDAINTPNGDVYVSGNNVGSLLIDSLIDDLRVYSRELSSAEVNDLYNWTGPAGAKSRHLLSLGVGA